MAPTLLAQKSSQSLLWKIEGKKGKPSYIFGTYHLVGSDYLKSHTKVEKAYEGSDKVMVEMVADSASLMQLSLLSTMPEKSLKKLVGEKDYQLLKKQIEPLIGYDLGIFDNLKPNMIATMYVVTIAQQNTPAEFQYGGIPIDMYFAQNGEEQGKEVIALETVTEQANILFNSETPEEQASQLVELVKDSTGTRDMAALVLKAYQEEDIQTMLEATDERGDAYGNMDILLNDRNLKWVDTLKEVLPDGGVFIAVGALHLPGKKGLIQLLKKEGYILSPVQ